jgi:CBS domain-containing protein
MKRLTIHQRVHVADDETTTTGAFVRCPEDDHWESVEGCRHCTKCVGVLGSAVACEPSRSERPSRQPAEASIVEVMDGPVLSIDRDLTAERALRALDEHGAPIALVVDQARHAIGVCSRRDLAQRRPSKKVEACMTPFLVTMLDGAKVADAIELIVERGVSHIPVLSAGRVVGIVTPRAVIRWLTQNLQPPRTRRAPKAFEG